MKKVLTYGTFDLIHRGHINVLRRGRELGDYLIVALSTDEFNKIEKDKVCYYTYDERKEILKEQCEGVYLPRTEGISTTQIKEDLASK